MKTIRRLLREARNGGVFDPGPADVQTPHLEAAQYGRFFRFSLLAFVITLPLGLVTGFLHLPLVLQGLVSMTIALAEMVIRLPFTFALNVIPVYFALLLFWRRVLRPTGPDASGNVAVNVVPALDPDMIRSAARAVLDSNEFVTTLRDALPSDKNSNLAQVPFILKTMNERRAAAEADASRFFWATILLGVAFSGVVLYYGYILVNESAAGFPAVVKELARGLDTFRSTTETLLDGDLPQLVAVRDAARKLEAVDRTPSVREAWAVIAPDVRSAGGYGNEIGGEIARLDEAFTKQLRDGTRETLETNDNRAFFAAYVGLANTLTSARKEFAALRERRAELLPRMESLLATSEKLSASEPSRVAELVKRLSVGLVVTTFLLAVLRYVAGLYREARTSIASLVEQEIATRRFCIAIASTKSDRGRDGVAAAFAEPRQSFVGPASIAELGDAAALEGILKEIRALLEKKVGS